MGFFDAVGSVAGKMEEQAKRKVAKMSNSEIQAILEKNPNSKIALEEARKRGIA